MEHPQKQELRVFISSTFRDLQPEREELVKKTFPRIRKECRERGVEFTEIDLRWGITEEESRTGKTVRICLEEIDRCRPYFIGILGSRYGWIPGMTEIEKDTELLKQFPWLAEYASSEKSIIEMEFAHGAMLRKSDSAFFYEQHAKTPLLTEERSRGEIGLGALKGSIQACGLPLRRFTTPEELSEQVFQDIVTILDRDFPAKRELTPLERERIEHEAYARNRLQSYVPNPEYYDIFEQRVNSTGAPLIVWGRSGLGKSALMAYFADEYKRRHPDAFLIQHFVGAAEGSDPEDVMRQMMMEIKERYQLSDAIPTDDNALREEFPLWLAKIREGEKIILLIDALNQLTGIGLEMHWLPDFIPANIRLVISTTTDSLPLEELRKRKWKELELKPLTETQRASIAEGFLERYSKSLPQEAVRELAMSPKTSSPLFLRTLLEELRIFGHYSTLREELEAYLASADERELFQKVLERMERDHGAANVRSVMTAIWASRHGLSESELMEVTGLPRMSLSILLTALEYHLMKREEFFTFFHNYLREAIELRYLPSDDERKAAHARLGEYFGTREYGPRRRDEEPWQWEEAGNDDRLSATLLDPGNLLLLTGQTHIYQFLAYWRSMESRIDVPKRIMAALEVLARSESADRLAKVALGIADYFVADSQFDKAQTTLQFLRTTLAENPEIEADRILATEAALLVHLGDYRAALPVYETLRTSYEARPDKKSELIDALLSISTIEYMLAQYDEALRNSLVARDIAIQLDNIPLIVDTLTNASACMVECGNLDGGIELAKETLAISRKGLGAEHPKTLQIMRNLAEFLGRRKEWGEAEKLYIACEKILIYSLGEKSNQYVDALNNHATLKYHQGDYKYAMELHVKRLRIFRERNIPEDHPEFIKTSLSLGSALAALGSFDNAIALYEKFLPLRILLFGETHPDVLNSKARYEAILKEKTEKMK